MVRSIFDVVTSTSAALTHAAGALAIAAVGAASADVPTRCTANVLHPISVHVTALDPVRRGADVHLRVAVSSFVPLDHVVARIVSSGTASVRGPVFANFGAVSPNHGASRDFDVTLPASGSRHYIQFQVTGQGPLGLLARGACYNLLPDGPLQAVRPVDSPDGVRLQQVAARRLP